MLRVLVRSFPPLPPRSELRSSAHLALARAPLSRNQVLPRLRPKDVFHDARAAADNNSGGGDGGGGGQVEEPCKTRRRRRRRGRRNAGPPHSGDFILVYTCELTARPTSRSALSVYVFEVPRVEKESVFVR